MRIRTKILPLTCGQTEQICNICGILPPEFMGYKEAARRLNEFVEWSQNTPVRQRREKDKRVLFSMTCAVKALNKAFNELGKAMQKTGMATKRANELLQEFKTLRKAPKSKIFLI